MMTPKPSLSVMGLTDSIEKPKRCCHLPMSLTLSLSVLGAGTAAAGIYLISKTLAAGMVLSNPIFLIGLGLMAAGLLLALGIWQLYLWQSKKTNAVYEQEPEKEPLTPNRSTP